MSGLLLICRDRDTYVSILLIMLNEDTEIRKVYQMEQLIARFTPSFATSQHVVISEKYHSIVTTKIYKFLYILLLKWNT